MPSEVPRGHETTFSLVEPSALLRVVRMRAFDADKHLREGVVRELGKPASCQRGCSHCCKAKIMTDAGTGAIIFLALKKAGRWTPAMRKRLADDDREQGRMTHAEWYGRPCVFLGAAGECTVHPFRPLQCQLTFSVDDPQLCTIGNGRSQFQLMPNADATSYLLEIRDALLRAMGEVPYDEYHLYSLPGAVLQAAAKIEQGKDADVWRVFRGDAPLGDPEAFVRWIDTQVTP